MDGEGGGPGLGSEVVQEFQQANVEVTERQADVQASQTQESALSQLEGYTAQHGNYEELRQFQQEQATLVDRQADNAAFQIQEPEPTRPDQVRQEGYAQGDGDYVSETSAALQNNATINRDYYAAAEAQEITADRSADLSYEKALDEQLAQIDNARSREREQEQER